MTQRLLRSMVPGILFTLVTGGLLLDLLITERLEEDFDQLLVSRAQALIGLTEYSEDGLEMELFDAALPGYSSTDAPEYFQITDGSGAVLMSSPSVEQWGMPVAPMANAGHAFQNARLPDGRAGRIMYFRFLPRLDLDYPGTEDDPESEDDKSYELSAIELPFNEGLDADAGGTALVGQRQDDVGMPDPRTPLLLQIAVSRQSLDSLARSVHGLLALTGLLVMGVIVAVTWRGIRNSVAPLKVLGAQVESMDEQRLTEPLALEQPVHELAQLTHSFNILRDRMATAFERERRFSGDVAHELRTPIAEIRTLLEVSERYPDDQELRAGFLQDVSDATERMQRTVETLLALSRAENQARERLPCADLGALLEKLISLRAAEADRRGIEVCLTGPDEAVSVAGRDQWTTIAGNLLDNALEYSAEGTTVNLQLDVGAKPGSISLSVQNVALNLDQADLAVMFDRLWRKDVSRTSAHHSGLGLALVKACSDQLGLAPKVSLTDGRLSIRIEEVADAEDGIPEFTVREAARNEHAARPELTAGELHGSMK